MKFRCYGSNPTWPLCIAQLFPRHHALLNLLNSWRGSPHRTLEAEDVAPCVPFRTFDTRLPAQEVLGR